MMMFLRSLTPLGVRLLGAALLVAVLAILFALQSCQTARTAKTEARLGKGQTEAALASGADAVESVGEVGARAAQTDALTKENSDAIRSAPGADAPVPAAVDSVARERLCRRAAYRGRPECMQFAPAR